MKLFIMFFLVAIIFATLTSTHAKADKEKLCKTAKCKNNIAAQFVCRSHEAYRKRCKT
ncbi:unnamed protein product [Acanthoscelides obtectus]|uniref:Uncharacterized protein n=1 Tax=Acanthoscelides obtectus TaxID=200917 RepID=A0A9P0KDW2_ACAOB|nr:unnamed protein product [Acanthoscelides obtectus]CAK1683115.1 hypothetical protein AOBTE_LOCUS34089 [Acanthoscelides obtectus]